jgi:hypothetical protein
MKDITVLLYWTNTREITSYWFDVKSAPISNSYLTYVQFAAGIMSYFLFHGIKLYCSINTHFSFDVFYAIINLKIVNFYKPWSNMKILMLFHAFADFDEAPNIDLCYKPYILWILPVNLFKATHPSDSLD